MLLEVDQNPFGSAFKCLYSKLMLFQHAASVCMVCFGLSNSAASAVTGILPAFVCLKKHCPFFFYVSGLKGVIWFLNKGFFVNINNSWNEEPHRSEDASAEKVRKEYNHREIILLTDEESHRAGQTFLQDLLPTSEVKCDVPVLETPRVHCLPSL